MNDSKRYRSNVAAPVMSLVTGAAVDMAATMILWRARKWLHRDGYRAAEQRYSCLDCREEAPVPIIYPPCTHTGRFRSLRSEGRRVWTGIYDRLP